MKKIILASIVAISFFATEAQTTKAKHKKAKKTYVSAETKAKAKQKAELARIQMETDKKIQDYKLASLTADSLRLDSERVANENFQMQEKAYLESRYKEIDSTNKATWTRFGTEKEQWSKTEQSLDAVNKAAKLGAYESRQVKVINQAYYDKAKVVTDNAALAPDLKKQQLVTLNTERRTKIKAVVGKAKERKLEKERKEYAKKNGTDSQAKWIDEVEGYAKK